MDPFEVRMQFLALLRRLEASQQSIQKVVGFAVKYFPSCGEDLWDCIVEECQKGSINSRMNVFHFLDSLCETCLLVKSRTSQGATSTNNLYVALVARDLNKIVESVVPEGRQGLPNLISTKQILESWRSKRVIEPTKIDDVLTSLTTRSSQSSSQDNASASLPISSTTTANATPNAAATTVTTTPTTTTAAAVSTSTSHRRSHHSRTPHDPNSSLSRNDVMKRIEDDRERHKRLRERRWVQPIAHNPATHQPLQLASFLPLTNAEDGEEELTIDIEFENEWETTSDWNEDDDEAALEEAELCFPAEGEGPMDLS